VCGFQKIHMAMVRNVLLLLSLVLAVPKMVLPQCDVFIEVGSVVVTDNGSGVKFTFDVTNNSSTDWYGDVLKMYWSLNSGAPIWNIDYSTGTSQPPIAPGETRTIKTPWFDIPNLPSWFPAQDPSSANPWLESMEWPYYGLPFPFEGSWSPVNLRLGSCGLADGAWVYDSEGELYYGPTNTDCPDVNSDALCDCDLEFAGFDPITLDIAVEVVSHWNCGQPLNGLGNINSSNNDAVGHVHFGIHVPGMDYQWGCTTGSFHPGWTFAGWSALNNPNQFLYSGDMLSVNLLNIGGNGACFQEILQNDTLEACPEIVIWQINYSQTLMVDDGGWAVNENSGDSTQEYPDFQIMDNSIMICEIPSVEGCTDPEALNYNPQADVDDGSCEYGYPNAYPGSSNPNTICNDGVTSNVYNITVFNSGDDTLFYYCVEIPEFDFDECFDGYEVSQYWIPPSEGQFVTQIIVPEGIEEFTVNIYLSEDESEETLSNNTITVPVVFNGPDPCPILGCTDEEAINYNPDANEDDGTCEYLDLTLDLGNDIIWTPQGTCVNPFYNQSFLVNNTGEGTIDNFSLGITVITWDGDIVYSGTQDYNISINPGESYTISDFPDIFTGDLNYVSATLTWINELGELEEDIQTFNLILYCWGCTDPEASNYTESEYIFDEIQDYWLATFPGIAPPTPEQIECTYDILGCTDPEAENYNPEANIDDGSCQIGGCTIVEACNYDPEATYNNGSCDFESCVGCTDSEAINYDPGATEDDGSCIYPIYGCTDPDAFNYNPLANTDDGSCVDVVVGCMIPEAINYDPLANIQCTPLDECCIFTEGCTDPEANNYDDEAIIDDGSCEYDIYGCNDQNAINYNPEANIDDGSCVYDPCSGLIGATYYAPNTFTPNNDGVNDGWTVVTDPDCWLRWEVLVYNRWGQLIWESNLPGEVWPGSVFDGGYYVADGVYFYKITGIGYDPANTFEQSGHITVFR